MTPKVDRAFVLVGLATRLPGKFSLRLEGVRIIDRVLAAVRSAGYRPTIVATRATPATGAPSLADRYDRGPLGAVRTIVESDPAPFLLVGGDMPFLSIAALERLRDLFSPGRSVVPRWNDGALEVLHAIYDVPPARVGRAWDRGASLSELVRSLGRAVRFVGAEEFDRRTFFDVDTPKDWRRAAAGAGPLLERGNSLPPAVSKPRTRRRLR